VDNQSENGVKTGVLAMFTTHAQQSLHGRGSALAIMNSEKKTVLFSLLQLPAHLWCDISGFCQSI
jgi:hypothetical protein